MQYFAANMQSCNLQPNRQLQANRILIYCKVVSKSSIRTATQTIIAVIPDCTVDKTAGSIVQTNFALNVSVTARQKELINAIISPTPKPPPLSIPQSKYIPMTTSITENRIFFQSRFMYKNGQKWCKHHR